eukprot:scaffold52180_cov14-Tisochrysis_lutea.AAC.2
MGEAVMMTSNNLHFVLIRKQVGASRARVPCPLNKANSAAGSKLNAQPQPFYALKTPLHSRFHPERAHRASMGKGRKWQDHVKMPAWQQLHADRGRSSKGQGPSHMQHCVTPSPHTAAG